MFSSSHRRQFIGDRTRGRNQHDRSIVYLCIPAAACTLISCLLARIFLGPSKKSIFLRYIVLAFAAMAGMAIPIFALIAAAGEWTFSGEVVLALLIYVIPLCVGVFASSGSTFAMMRIATTGLHARPK